jgi:hypothetical protein
MAAQYSLARIIVSTRVVFAGSAGSIRDESPLTQNVVAGDLALGLALSVDHLPLGATFI